MVRMLTEYIHDLSDYISESFDPYNEEHVRIIQKGLLLHMQQMVRSIKGDSNKIVAEVQDVVPVQVKLDWDDFSELECSCPSPGICRHIVAVFFSLYARQRLVSNWVDNWRSPHRKTVQHVRQAAHSTSNIEGGLFEPMFQNDSSDSFKSNYKETSIEKYKHWVQEVDERFDYTLSTRGNVYPTLMNILMNNILQKLDRVLGLNREEIPLFKLVVNLRLLHKFLEWADNTRYSYDEIEYTCSQFMNSVSHNIEMAIDSLTRPLPISFDPVLDELVKETRELLFLEGPFQRKVITLYWHIWVNVLTSSKLRESELTYAKKISERSNPDSLWKLAYSFHLFWSGDALEALKKIEDSSNKHFEFAFFFLDYFVHTKQWNGITEYAPRFIERVKDFLYQSKYNDIKQYVGIADRLFSRYAEATNRFDIYERVLIEMLPYSSGYIANFYSDTKNFKKLMDFLQVSGVSTDLLNSAFLKEIQKERPEYLLPLYHKEVSKAIAEKNRKSYKHAVRYLKKLRTVYKKLKQDDVWERYFDELLEETKRLRAFQEECQKGKLINVENETA